MGFFDEFKSAEVFTPEPSRDVQTTQDLSSPRVDNSGGFTQVLDREIEPSQPSDFFSEFKSAEPISRTDLTIDQSVSPRTEIIEQGMKVVDLSVSPRTEIIEQGMKVVDLGVEPQPIPEKVEQGMKVVDLGVEPQPIPEKVDYQQMMKEYKEGLERGFEDISKDIGTAAVNLPGDVVKTSFEIGKGLAVDLPKLAISLTKKEERDEFLRIGKELLKRAPGAAVDFSGRFINDDKFKADVLDAVKQRAIDRPFATALDVSVVLNLLGGGARVAGAAAKAVRAAKTAEKISKVGRGLQKTAKAVDPFSATSSAFSALGKGLKKIKVAPFKKAVDTSIQKIAKARGVELPLGAQTSSRSVQLIESIAAKGLFGRKVADRFDKALESTSRFADRIVQSAKGLKDSELAGSKVIDGLDKFRTRFTKFSSDIYKKVGLKEQGRKITVKPEKALNVLNSILRAEIAADKINKIGSQRQFFSRLRTRLKSKRKPINAFEVKSLVRRMQQGINYKGELISTGNNGKFKRLVGALNNDFKESLRKTAPELAKSLDEADNIFKSGIEVLNNQLGRTINRLRNNPQKIVDLVLSKNISSDDVFFIKEAMGKSFKDLQSSMLKRILSNAVGKKGNILSTKIDSAIKNIPRDKLALLFRGDQMKAISDLKKIANAIDNVGNIVGGSQTAFLQRFKPGALISSILQGTTINTLIGSENASKIFLEGIKPFDLFSKTIKRRFPKGKNLQALKTAKTASILQQRIKEISENEK